MNDKVVDELSNLDMATAVASALGADTLAIEEAKKQLTVMQYELLNKFGKSRDVSDNRRKSGTIVWTDENSAWQALLGDVPDLDPHDTVGLLSKAMGTVVHEQVDYYQLLAVPHVPEEVVNECLTGEERRAAKKAIMEAKRNKQLEIERVGREFGQTGVSVRHVGETDVGADEEAEHRQERRWLEGLGVPTLWQREGVTIEVEEIDDEETFASAEAPGTVTSSVKGGSGRVARKAITTAHESALPAPADAASGSAFAPTDASDPSSDVGGLVVRGLGPSAVLGASRLTDMYVQAVSGADRAQRRDIAVDKGSLVQVSQDVDTSTDEGTDPEQDWHDNHADTRALRGSVLEDMEVLAEALEVAQALKKLREDAIPAPVRPQTPPRPPTPVAAPAPVPARTPLERARALLRSIAARMVLSAAGASGDGGEREQEEDPMTGGDAVATRRAANGIHATMSAIATGTLDLSALAAAQATPAAPGPLAAEDDKAGEGASLRELHAVHRLEALSGPELIAHHRAVARQTAPAPTPAPTPAPGSATAPAVAPVPVTAAIDADGPGAGDGGVLLAPDEPGQDMHAATRVMAAPAPAASATTPEVAEVKPESAVAGSVVAAADGTSGPCEPAPQAKPQPQSCPPTEGHDCADSLRVAVVDPPTPTAHPASRVNTPASAPAPASAPVFADGEPEPVSLAQMLTRPLATLLSAGAARQPTLRTLTRAHARGDARRPSAQGAETSAGSGPTGAALEDFHPGPVPGAFIGGGKYMKSKMSAKYITPAAPASAPVVFTSVPVGTSPAPPTQLPPAPLSQAPTRPRTPPAAASAPAPRPSLPPLFASTLPLRARTVTARPRASAPISGPGSGSGPQTARAAPGAAVSRRPTSRPLPSYARPTSASLGVLASASVDWSGSLGASRHAGDAQRDGFASVPYLATLPALPARAKTKKKSSAIRNPREPGSAEPLLAVRSSAPPTSPGPSGPARVVGGLIIDHQ